MTSGGNVGTRESIWDDDVELARLRVEWAEMRRRAAMPSAFDALTDEEQRQLIGDAFDDDGVLL